MPHELVPYIRGLLFERRKRPRQVEVPLEPFEMQKESILPQVAKVLEPILYMRSNSIGEEGFRRLGEVTLRNHYREMLSQYVEGSEEEFSGFPKRVGNGWEIHGHYSVSRRFPPEAGANIWFPSLQSHDRDWNINYVDLRQAERSEMVRIKFGDDKFGAREWLGLTLPNAYEFKFRFIHDQHGNDEYIEVIFSHADKSGAFVLDRKGMMLGEDQVYAWGAAHGWKPATVGNEIDIMDSFRVISGSHGQSTSENTEPKIIE